MKPKLDRKHCMRDLANRQQAWRQAFHNDRCLAAMVAAHLVATAQSAAAGLSRHLWASLALLFFCSQVQRARSLSNLAPFPREGAHTKLLRARALSIFTRTHRLLVCLQQVAAFSGVVADEDLEQRLPLGLRLLFALAACALTSSSRALCRCRLVRST